MDLALEPISLNFWFDEIYSTPPITEKDRLVNDESHAPDSWFRRLADNRRFQSVVLAVILLNAAIAGMETSAEFAQRHRGAFQIAQVIITAIFVIELVIRITAHRPRFGRFFRDGWNVFDFAIVAVSLLPGVGSFATLARIARVLRVARLVSVSPKLRLIVGTMTRSIPSLAHVSLLLGLLLYIYGVVGVNLFGAHDPQHWGSLGRALLTLFQILTLEGWVEIQAASIAHLQWSWLYYASFIMVTVFVVVNLFIAVVLNNLDEIREEDRLAAVQLEMQSRGETAEAANADAVQRHIATLRAELDRLEIELRQRPPAG